MADLFQNLHPAVIHFPLVGIFMAFGSGLIALLIVFSLDVVRYYEQRKLKELLTRERIELAWRYVGHFEFTSWIAAVMGEVGLIVAGLTGLYDADGIDAAMNNKFISFKVQLSLYLFFILLVPIMLKVYVALVHGRSIFGARTGNDSPDSQSLTYKIPPILYLFTLAICTFLAMLIAGTGGKIVYGHSILDSLGLGFLIPL